MSDPKQIWLAPWCAWCEKNLDERLWSEDRDAFVDCEEFEECTRKPVRYVLASKPS